MAFTPQYGMELVKDKAWISSTVVNPGPAESNPAEIFDLDPVLPIQGSQPHPDNIELDFVMIPRARIVGGTASRTLSSTGRPKLTMADGYSIKPVGFTFENVVIPATQARPVQPPRFWRAGYIEAPYLAAVNDAYGALNEGDYVAAHYGSTDSLVEVGWEDRGKPVKWVEKAIYAQTVAASATVVLQSATLPGIRPRIVLGLSVAGLAVTGTPTLAWSTASNKWVVTFGSAVSTVIYEYGQSVEHRAGQVIRIRQVSSTQEHDGWLRWVEQDYSNTIMPPMSYDYPTTSVGFDSSGQYSAGSAITPTATSEANIFNLSHGKIVPHKKIIVHIVSGALLDLEGTLTDITGTDLQLRSGAYFENYAVGQYYRIDFIKGILYMSDQIVKSDGQPIAASDIKVSYHYASKYEYGRTTLLGYGVGLRGQTDGRYTGLPGTPIHLERAANDRRFSAAAGNFGAMRILFQ